MQYMKPKIFVVLTLFIAVAMAQTVLEPVYPFSVDENNFVELRATAGYYKDNQFYCYNTNVSVQIDGISYELDKFVNCKYSKFVQLPRGNYSVIFTADYPYDSSEQWARMLEVEGEIEATLVVYSPKSNFVYRTDELIYIEAIGKIRNEVIEEGQMIAEFMQNNSVMNSMDLPQDYIGSFKGNLKANVSDGDYELRLTLTTEHFTVTKNIPIKISTEVTNETVGPAAVINVLYPESDQNYNLNTTVVFEIEFLDANSLIMSDANLTMNVLREGTLFESIEMEEGRYVYKKNYLFDTPGRYTINFVGELGEVQASNSMFLTVGNATQIGESVNFTVQILIPQSDVYAVGSSIVMRARARLGETPLPNASLELEFMGETYNMSYDRFGEYIYTTETLAIQGSYEAIVTARYQGLLDKDSVEFMISGHYLNISLLEPDIDEPIMVEEAEPLAIELDIFDEHGDIVFGAEVVAEILEPGGRKLETQVFQDSVTGKYKTVVYPNEAGEYDLKITASKPGYVSDVDEYTYDIQFPKQGIFPSEINYETLLMIILGIAILILVAAFLKLIF